MTFQMLKILWWGLLFLFMAEVGLEYRAYRRGFDTIAFGSYQRQGAEADAPAVSPTMQPANLGDQLGEKKSGEIRYWIASSSHAEDSYLSREVIFPTRLEGLLRESGQRALVINASHAGMNIQANQTDLEARGNHIHPDIVILYQMSSQITELSKLLLSPRRSGSTKAKDPRIPPPPPPQPNMIVRLFENTSVYALLKGNLSNRLAGQRVLADTLGEQGDAAFERQVMAFVRTARRIGAEPVLCTFATSHTRSQFPSIPGAVSGFLFRYNMYLSVMGWLETVDRFNDVIRRIAAKEHLRLVELDTVLSGREAYFRDFVHFTPEGHARVAQAIFSQLRQGSAPAIRVAAPNAGLDRRTP
jgi:hypothetical protein